MLVIIPCLFGFELFSLVIDKLSTIGIVIGLDYHLLEDVKRLAESAQRTRVKLCGSHPHFRLPFHLKALQSCAASKGTKLLFLPYGMTKREKNQTRYNQR